MLPYSCGPSIVTKHLSLGLWAMQNMLSCSFVAMQLRNLAFDFLLNLLAMQLLWRFMIHIHNMVVLYGYLYSLQA